MDWSDFSQTATATAVFSTSIPARYASTNNVRNVCMGIQGATNVQVIAFISGTVMQWGQVPDYNTWPSGQVAGISGGSLSWNI
jgi:hypothetical protein